MNKSKELLIGLFTCVLLAVLYWGVNFLKGENLFSNKRFFYALYDNVDGDGNTATGYGALANNTGANRNTAFGYQALHTATTGGSNQAVGHYCLYNLTTGGSNDALCYTAG